MINVYLDILDTPFVLYFDENILHLKIKDGEK